MLSRWRGYRRASGVRPFRRRGEPDADTSWLSQPSPPIPHVKAHPGPAEVGRFASTLTTEASAPRTTLRRWVTSSSPQGRSQAHLTAMPAGAMSPSIDPSMVLPWQRAGIGQRSSGR
jgi:hypothetical protein